MSYNFKYVPWRIMNNEELWTSIVYQTWFTNKYSIKEFLSMLSSINFRDK